MSRRKKGELPRYRLHKQSGQAVVSLPTGGVPRYRDVLLGPFDSEASKREYTRVIDEWLAAGKLAPPRLVNGRCPDLTVAEVCLRFWKHAEVHYRLVDGSSSRELDHFKYALLPVVELYGAKPAAEFGPVRLKAVRQHMIETRWFFVRFPAEAKAGSRWVSEKHVRLDTTSGQPNQNNDPLLGQAEWEEKWWRVEIRKSRKGLARKLVNQRIDHIKRVFKWAVSEELVPASVHEALKTVAGLRRGYPGTYERPKVKPVPPKNVEAVLPFLAPQVAAMVQLQPLIGARETEICLMRGHAIDRTGPVWWYVIDPNEVARNGQPVNLHKTAHHETSDGSAEVKRLPIGPKAQVILKPWLRDEPDEFLFQPREARQKQNAERRAQRKTALWPSHIAHQAKKKKLMPNRVARDHYDRHSYARAIARACKKAGVPHWHPHQLKHNCGTDVKKKYGLEGSRAYMGHTKLSTTEIYAEKDMELVEKIALEMG
jgi:integrase